MVGNGRHIAVGALVVAYLLLAAPAHAGTPAACYGEDEAAVACLVNEARAAMGLDGLRRHALLKEAAGDYARRMVRNGFFSHRDPNGDGPRQRMIDSGYGWNRSRWKAGEALAHGDGILGSAQAAVVFWLASPSHRRVILSRRFKHVGVGISRNPTDLGELPKRTFVLYTGRR